MLHIILYQPEIPQNTGNIGRLCAYTQTSLHLIHPLGFRISDKYLKRSGMDYWDELKVFEHDNWEAFLNSPSKPKRIWLFSTKAKQSFWDARFQEGDGLLFGNEGSGVPSHVHEWSADKRLTLPSFDPKLRSLNLATSVGIATYEALRQITIT